jgi:predicted metal-dependent phosphoesterase TrpH
MLKINPLLPNSSETRGKVDLHIHSNQSDGALSYQEIIDYSIKIGLKTISITDHDDISALGEAEKYSMDRGLEFISGIEISAQSKNIDVHMLGYFINHQHAYLKDYVAFFQNERLKRVEKIVKLLNKSGIPLDLETVKSFAQKGSIGRPHIAEAMVKQGLVSGYQEAFNKYIGDGRPYAIAKFKISPEQAISLINHADGICVLAHPGDDFSTDIIHHLIKSGLEGIETIHPRHSQQQVDFYREIVKKNGLIETGGSDCHGKNKGDSLIGRMNVPYSFVQEMKNRISPKH